MDNHHTAEELRQLHNVWLRFIDDQGNGQESDWHMPPAMAEAMQGTAQAYLKQQDFVADPKDDNDFQHNWDIIVRYGDYMFNFGQYAYANGLLRANMTPCTCIHVSDDQIESFFDGIDFSKGD